MACLMDYLEELHGLKEEIEELSSAIASDEAKDYPNIVSCSLHNYRRSLIATATTLVEDAAVMAKTRVIGQCDKCGGPKYG